jgi:hypothetical protein
MNKKSRYEECKKDVKKAAIKAAEDRCYSPG